MPIVSPIVEPIVETVPLPLTGNDGTSGPAPGTMDFSSAQQSGLIALLEDI